MNNPILKRSGAGFTLVELLVTIAIVAIVASIALPALSRMVQDAAISTRADQLMAGLQYTRTEAVKRNARVTMCRSANGTACAASATLGQWHAGWIVFVDGGSAAEVDSGDEILRVQPALKGQGSLVGSGDVASYVSYTSTGQARLAGGGPQAGAFSACAELSGIKRRRIALTPGSGWVGVVQLAPAAVCTA